MTLELGAFCEGCSDLKAPQLVLSVDDGPPYCLACAFANGDASEEAVDYVQRLDKKRGKR